MQPLFIQTPLFYVTNNIELISFRSLVSPSSIVGEVQEVLVGKLTLRQKRLQWDENMTHTRSEHQYDNNSFIILTRRPENVIESQHGCHYSNVLKCCLHNLFNANFKRIQYYQISSFRKYLSLPQPMSKNFTSLQF